MDNNAIKGIVENVVKKIVSNKELLSAFRSDPASAVRQAAGSIDLKGIELNDQLIKSVVSNVKTSIAGDDGKLDISDIGGIIGKAKDLIGGKKDV